MNCQKIEKRFSLYVYDELEPRELAEVKEHLQACPACKARLEQYRRVHGLLTEKQQITGPPGFVPDWDQSWRVVLKRLTVSQPGYRIANRFLTGDRFPSLQMVRVMTAAAVLFLAGILVGVFMLKSPVNPILSDGQGDSGMIAVESQQGAFFLRDFQDHLENIKPVIIEYSNYWSTENETELPVQKETVINLLMQNQLLLCRIPANGSDDRYNRAMQQLLNEMQLILTRIAILTLHDPDSISNIKRMIRRKGLLFKMESLRPAGESESAL